MNARGIAMLAGLVLLAAISLMALVAASGMLVQKQMAANFAQGANALENSEIAMSYASAWLYSRSNHEREAHCIVDCLLPVAFHNMGEVPALPEYESAAWWRNNAVEAGLNPISGESAISTGDMGSEPPRWILEELSFQAADGAYEDGTEGIGYYRILGRGTGAHPSSVAVTESIVARPWGGSYTLSAFPHDPDMDNFCQQFAPDLSPSLDCGRLAWRQRR